MLNDHVAFRYPVSLYFNKIQGNVLLRRCWLARSRLRFRAARLRGTVIPVSLLFPVHFRHPEGPKLPGDSL